MRNSGAKAWEATVRKSQGVLKRRTRMSSASHIDVDESCDDSDGGGDTNSLKAVKTNLVPKSPNQETYVDEKVLSNGDFYTGEWSDSLPNGTGKYLWTDGCMYFGDWYRGKTMGKGRFCWPTGATYEGEFKNGYMDGNGIYIGSNGATYRGCWASNVRHGEGTKHYTNGDCYEGEWRRGVQEGRGRYQWRNGNQYIGQWKNGTISGNGTLIWANGNRYDGFWEDGLPKGNGTFRWADGRFYVGFWSKDPKQQKGTYYGDSSGSPLDWDPQEVYCVDLSECKIFPTENLPFLSSQKPLEWSGLGSEPAPKQAMWRLSKVVDSCGKLRRSVEEKRILERAFEKLSMSEPADGNVTSDFADEDASVRNLELDNMDSIGTPGRNMKQQHKGDTKRPGETISKGHKNYELMLNLQLGIRHAVGRPSPETPSLDLKPSAFDPKEKIWTRFPPEGSKHTPPHQSCEFKWKDYCPLVFRTLRMLFKVDAADYMLSICGDEALRELSSPGKSGSFFYLTHDDRYMIKTMKKNEVKTLLKMLSPYYNHVRAFEHTLVTKFFGLHCVKLGVNQRKVRFVIMGNLFCTEYAIHRRFDLKGSSHGRTTDKPEEEIDGNTTLKDLDLNYVFRLPGDWVQEFQRQVDRDCDFLELEGVMDYSLLVGIHFKDREKNTDQASEDGSSTPMGNDDESEPAEDTDDRTQESIRLGISMEARVEKTIRKNDCDSQSQIMVGEATGEFHDVILFFGIIDILQDYDISKKLEHAYKAFQYDPTSISAVDPKQYSRRFRDFIYQVFAEDV